MNYTEKLSKVINKSRSKQPYRFLNVILNSLFNGINRKEYVVITGLPSSGKRSFVDTYYLIGLLQQWYKKEDEERELTKLKIIYFSTKYPEESKMMKWASHIYSKKTNKIMDIPTLTKGAGRLFNISKNREDAVFKHFKIFEDAIEAGVLEVHDHDITPLYIERKLHEAATSMGEIEYLSNGELAYSIKEEFENSITIVIIDDVDNIKGSESDFGEGKMLSKEILSSIDDTLTKYSSMGMTVVAIKGTEIVSGFKQYSPTAKEFKGLSPNKSITIFNPFQEKYNSFLQFDTLEYVDASDINRLRFAYISYNETGVSNMYVPLLFMPENGRFATLKFIRGDTDSESNLDQFRKFEETRKKF